MIYNINLRTKSHIADIMEVDSASVDDLRIEVARFVSEMLRDHALAIWVDQDWQVDVTDERGFILFVLQLSAYASPLAKSAPDGL